MTELEHIRDQKAIPFLVMPLSIAVLNKYLRTTKGGRFELGFISAFTSSPGLSLIDGISNNPIAIMGMGAAIGGTAESLGGGKFANGAITGDFVGLFNDGMHPQQSKDPDPRDIKLTKVKDLRELVNTMRDLSEQYKIEIGGAVVILNGVTEYYVLPAEFNGTVNKIDEAQFHGSMLPKGSRMIEHYHTHLTNNSPSYMDAFNAYQKRGAMSYVLANISVYRVNNSVRLPARGQSSYGNNIGNLSDWENGIFTGR